MVNSNLDSKNVQINPTTAEHENFEVIETVLKENSSNVGANDNSVELETTAPTAQEIPQIPNKSLVDQAKSNAASGNAAADEELDDIIQQDSYCGLTEMAENIPENCSSFTSMADDDDIPEIVRDSKKSTTAKTTSVSSSQPEPGDHKSEMYDFSRCERTIDLETPATFVDATNN